MTLKGTKFKWLHNFPVLRRELYSANLKTSRAWRLKESFRRVRGHMELGALSAALGRARSAA
jgi:hypothetical protein